ncbi:MAG TPA: hypothetical protein VI298_10380 [Geobacteraceae bacterium]
MYARHGAWRISAIQSGVVPGGRGESAYLRAVNGEVELVTSVPILTELARKLKEKFHWEDDRIKESLPVAGFFFAIIRKSQKVAVSVLLTLRSFLFRLISL